MPFVAVVSLCNVYTSFPLCVCGGGGGGGVMGAGGGARFEV